MNINLITACANNDYNKAKLLLQQGDDIHLLNDYALKNTCILGFVEIVKLLLDHGAYITDEQLKCLSDRKTEIQSLITKQLLINKITNL